MAIVLFDNLNRKALYPLVVNKAVGMLRMGIFTAFERWQLLLDDKVYLHTIDYLLPLYEAIPEEEIIWIDAAVLPTDALITQIKQLQLGEAIADASGLIAGKAIVDSAKVYDSPVLDWFHEVNTINDVQRIVEPNHLFELNDKMIRFDFTLITQNRQSQILSSSNQLIGDGQLFIEEGTSIEGCTINTSNGPVYIAKDATIMEGSCIRGPFVLGENSVVKMGAKIYGATTLGPGSMAGGEVKNVVMQGYSNKAHEGYLGDSVIGEWCNFGAGTSNSNVKNTGSNVKLYNYGANDYVEVGQKCGVIVGDYSRFAINSSINTGTVVGVCCNVFGKGLLPKFIPDFSWGTDGDFYSIDKALMDIDNWKKMKHKNLEEMEVKVLKHIFAAENK